LPALEAVLIRPKSMEGFESLGKVVSVQEIKQMFSKSLVVFVVITFNGGYL
jgi:hypothetical protein